MASYSNHPPQEMLFLAMPLGLQATAPPLAPTGRARKALNGLAGIRRTEHNCLKLDLLHIAGVIQPKLLGVLQTCKFHISGSAPRIRA